MTRFFLIQSCNAVEVNVLIQRILERWRYVVAVVMSSSIAVIMTGMVVLVVTMRHL